MDQREARAEAGGVILSFHAAMPHQRCMKATADAPEVGQRMILMFSRT